MAIQHSRLNPSLEHFSRILAEQFCSRLDAPEVEAIEVKMWEDDIAAASY